MTLVSMLFDFNKFCNDNNLRYSLCAGSLLGAIRHKGIIPWDDDVDVMMPRPDYNRLIELTADGFMNHYSVIHAENNSNYYLPMAKMVDNRTKIIEDEIRKNCPLGIFIDIFPCDGVPEDTIIANDVYNRFRKLTKTAKIAAAYVPFTWLYKCDVNTPFINRIKAFLKNRWYKFKGIKSYQLFKEADRLISACDYNKSKQVRLYTSYQYHKFIFDKDIFEKYIDVEFNGIIVKSIKNYDEYLTTLYKNYMKLPPVEKQVCHHSHYYLDY